ncbi:MAG: hypothetical protein HY342_06890, partial [Candidatus Lambdaproteobacteria bacterium]|nr:hypothetical protein [Candidatus Lambdaproteobacteria bacterium]
MAQPQTKPAPTRAAAAGDWVARIAFAEESPAQLELRAALRRIAQHLEPLPDPLAPPERQEVMDILNRRESVLHQHVHTFYTQGLERLARADLGRGNAFETIFEHARFLDELLRFAFETSLDELPWHVALQKISAERELAFNRSLLPQKEQKLEQMRSVRRRMAEDHPDADPEELAYFANIEATLEKELADVRRSVARIEAQLPVL